MKKIYLIVLSALFYVAGYAQLLPANYTFAATAGTYTPLTGTPVGIAVVNGVNVGNVPIGFNFTYMGKVSTICNVSTSGFISFSSAAIGATGFTSNNMFSGGYGDIIAPLWDNNALTATTDLTYATTGVAPNRVFTVEWANVKWSSLAATAGINFQVQLEETTNKITFVYQTAAGALSSASASVGLTINSTGNSGSSPALVGSTTVGQKFASLNNISAAPTVSTSSETTTISAKPADGQTFTFTPNNNTTPAAATNLTFSCIGSASTRLTWTDNATDEVVYYIYQSTTAGVFAANPTIALPANSNTYSFSGLAAGTTYYYRVVAVNEGGGPSAVLENSQATAAAGTVTAIASGNWNDCNIWSGGIPGPADNVIIKDGFTVTVNDVTANCNNLTVGDGVTVGNVTFDATGGWQLTVNGNLSVGTSSGISVNTAGTNQSHQLWIYGNVVNLGNINLSDGGNITASRKVNIFFKGTANQTFTGAGTTDFGNINIDKGTGNITLTSPVAEINTNFTVADANTDAGIGGGFIGITTLLGNGILKFSGTNTISTRGFAATGYTIRASAGLWINNPNFTMTAQGNTAVLSGLLYISNGTYNIGTGIGNSFDLSNNCIFRMDGGSLTIAGRFAIPSTGLTNNVDFGMSAGILRVSNVGHASATVNSFDLGTGTAGRFVMSGGTIIISKISQASGDNGYRTPNTYNTLNITGGTVQFGDATTVIAGTNRTFVIRGTTSVATPSIVVDNTSTISPFLTYNVNVNTYGDLTLNGTGTLTYGLGDIILRGNSATNPGNIINNGMTITTGASGTRVLEFSSSFGNQSYTQNAGTLGNIANLTINNTAVGGTVSSSVPFTVQNSSASATPSVKLINGTLNASNLTIGTTGTASYIVERTNGVLSGTPTYALNGSGGRTIRYLWNSATPRNIGEEWPASVQFGTLEIGTITTNGKTYVTLTGDRSLTGTLKMGNGTLFNDTAVIITGANVLTLGSSPAATGTLTYNLGRIQGNFKRWIATTATSYRFPMGDDANLKDAVINFTTAPATGGTLTARWSSIIPTFPNVAPLSETGATPQIDITSAMPNGSWFIDAADGLTGGNYTGTFTANGTSGLLDFTKAVLIKRPSVGGDWTLDGAYVTASGSNSAPVISRTGMSGFSEFGVGVPVGVLPINVEYLRGTKQLQANLIDWKVTCTNAIGVTITVERSSDGRSFTAIHSITADALRCLQPFNYADVNAPAGKNYYRLKMKDSDGKVTYSTIIMLLNRADGFDIAGILPSLVKNTALLNVSAAQKTQLKVVVTDANGRQVQQQNFALVAGSNQLAMNFGNLAAGTYYVTGYAANGSTVTVRFIKQ
jgi:hypothetical protein